MKVGILTYHYSNNYGGILQSFALFRTLIEFGIDVEIINYVPSSYKNSSIFFQTGLRKNIFKMDFKEISPQTILKRVFIKHKYAKQIIKEFDAFRAKYMKMTPLVDEKQLSHFVNNYDLIIVGSDQVWSPSQRTRNEYFLGFDSYNGLRVSYAADSTIANIEPNVFGKLQHEIRRFDSISVRNQHTCEFVRSLVGKDVPVVADPTLLLDFSEVLQESNSVLPRLAENYILVYVLGKEINGSNRRALERIKERYGNMKVFAITIPTMKFNFCTYADEVLYNLGPLEWLHAINNASFVLTDSYHGTLFSIKFKKPFLAYYSEKLRSTRFKDLAQRYKIDEFIVSNVDEIDAKSSLSQLPDFEKLQQIINLHKEYSMDYLHKALRLPLKA